MHKNLYPVPETFAVAAQVKHVDYERMYAESIEDPDRFWGRIGRRIDWIQEFSRVKDSNFADDDCHIRWFDDGKLNVSSNCLDRHLEARGHKTAIIWEGDDPNIAEHISYRELYERVCQCANGLKSLGVAKGDRVTIYLPMIPEIAIAMLACARLGAVHSVVFAGFSAEALGGRIADCDSSLVITANEGLRGGKRVPLKHNVDGALSIKGTECVKHVLVVRRTGGCDPMGARASENTLRKDHAPNSSQNRRERARPVGRHIDASGSKRRKAAH
jgi:acetyl-CoA synthetase